MTEQPDAHQMRGASMVRLTLSSVRRLFCADEAILILVRDECPHCARLIADIE